MPLLPGTQSLPVCCLLPSRLTKMPTSLCFCPEEASVAEVAKENVVKPGTTLIRFEMSLPDASPACSHPSADGCHTRHCIWAAAGWLRWSESPLLTRPRLWVGSMGPDGRESICLHNTCHWIRGQSVQRTEAGPVRGSSRQRPGEPLDGEGWPFLAPLSGSGSLVLISDFSN